MLTLKLTTAMLNTNRSEARNCCMRSTLTVAIGRGFNPLKGDPGWVQNRNDFFLRNMIIPRQRTTGRRMTFL